jgi:DNA primase
VTWDEVVKGFRLGDFTMRNVPQRVNELGDLYRPLLIAKGRVELEKFLKGAHKPPLGRRAVRERK